MRFLTQAQKIIDTWVQKQAPDGYIGTSPQGFEIGPRWYQYALWEHKYTLLGMLEYYNAFPEKQVLESAKKIGNIICSSFGFNLYQLRLSASDHAGMQSLSVLEPMTYLYKITGDKKYLDFCNYIIKDMESPEGPKIIHELTQGSGRVDKVGNGKGYEMLSCIIGILRMYQLTGNKVYMESGVKAWADITKNRLYITGTATQCEKFFDNHWLPASENDSTPSSCWCGKTKGIRMGEGCVTAHWIILNEILFSLTGESKYIDEIEKSVYNHLLGSQSPVDGKQSYYVPLIGHKTFVNFNVYEGMPPCCLSSVSRCIAKIPDLIFESGQGNEIAVLLYNTAQIKDSITTKDGKKIGYTLKLETDYPSSGSVNAVFSLDAPAIATLKFRVPGWCKNYTSTLNGKVIKGKAGDFLTLEQLWNKENSIEIIMDMNDRMVDGAPQYKNHYALMHGPLVLCLDEFLNPGIDVENVTIDKTSKFKVSTSKLPEKWIGKIVFSIPEKSSDNKELLFVPFIDAGQQGTKYNTWINGE